MERALARFEPINVEGSSENPAPRSCKTIPVSPATIPDPKFSKMLLINETALRSLSTTVKVNRVAVIDDNTGLGRFDNVDPDG